MLLHLIHTSVGYVEFVDEESVSIALEMTGSKLLGIPIIVQLTEAEKNRQARQSALEYVLFISSLTHLLDQAVNQNRNFTGYR